MSVLEQWQCCPRLNAGVVNMQIWAPEMHLAARVSVYGRRACVKREAGMASKTFTEYLTECQIPRNSLYRHHPTYTSGQLREVGTAIFIYWASRG